MTTETHWEHGREFSALDAEWREWVVNWYTDEGWEPWEWEAARYLTTPDGGLTILVSGGEA